MEGRTNRQNLGNCLKSTVDVAIEENVVCHGSHNGISKGKLASQSIGCVRISKSQRAQTRLYKIPFTVKQAGWNSPTK